MIINSHIINANPGEAGTPAIVQSTLPDTYRRVLGFALNNNAYWAITGVTLNGDDTVRISFSVSAACNVFGCYSSASATNNFSLYASTSSGAKYLRYGNGTYLSYFSSSNLNQRFDVVVSGTGTSGMPTDSSWTQLSFTGTKTFCIGTTATDATSSKFVGSVYGDVAVDGKFYGIPCERISDNKLGYYDVISGTFFQPTGSGVVSLGDDAAVTLSPVVTNTTGYIEGGTIEGNPTTISASDLVSGTKNLTDTSVTDVTNYANAQIVDSNLTAANIANGVTVLGITGTHQGGITPTGTIEISSTDSSNPDDVTNYAGAYVAAGTAGTPTATKGTVNNHSVSVTPSVTNTTGYITGSTKTGTPVSVSASELVSGTISTITTSTTDVTNYQYASAPAGTAGTPTATKGTVVNHAIAVTPSVTNTTGYITGSTKTGTAVTVMASELVSGTKNLTDTSSTDVTNYASAQVVDSNLTAGNIKKDVSILGVTGSYEGSGGGGTMQSKSVTLGATMPSTTTPDSGYDGLSSVSYTLDTSVIKSSNIKSGATILGVSGDPMVINTYIGSIGATASDILSGKSAYVNGSYVAGTGTGGSAITQYITFTATSANSTVKLTQSGTAIGTWKFKYSTDNTTWSDYTMDTSITLSAIGDYVSFAGIDNYNTIQDTSSYKKFVTTGGVRVSGKLAGFYGQSGDFAGPHAYHYLFQSNTKITSITGLTAPSCVIQTYALYGLFYGCTGISEPLVSLPSTRVDAYGYAQMYSGCTKLTSNTQLPATELGSYAYYNMYRGCTSLGTTVTSLPATSLPTYVYNGMYYGCSNLVTHCSLPATTIATACYQSMFQNCSKLTTIASLPATTMKSSCYSAMYRNDTLIKVSSTQTGDYQTGWRIPTSGTGTTASSFSSNMLTGTGGTFTSNPVIDTTYYTSNTVV